MNTNNSNGRHQLASAIVLIVFLARPYFAHSAEENRDTAEVKVVVIKMNAAFSKRDIPGILTSFEEGAAKVSLFKAHGPKHGPNDSDSKITHSDLKDQWTAMFGILFKVSKSYERKVTNIKVHVDQDIAVVWADMTSVIVLSSGDAASENKFTEVLTLRKFGGKWKIAAISNNNHD